MDFALNDEQQEFKERCRTFAREVIRPRPQARPRGEHPLGGDQRGPQQGFGASSRCSASAATARARWR